jgi:DNA-binding CsgD family transcriptional regulator/tetratricopeptide (TPR) repeat protein
LHPSPATTLVGRSDELAILRELLDRAGNGSGGAAVIEGEAGIGKTRLLTEALNEAQARGFQVYRGAAQELDRDRPFGALVGALSLTPDAEDPYRAAVGRLLSDPGDEDRPAMTAPQPLRFRLVDDLLALVESLAAVSPVVMALEDLQWADALTLQAFRHLVRRVEPLPIVLVGTARLTPRSPELARAIEDVGGRGIRMILPPLDHPFVSELVTELVGGTPGPGLLGAVAAAAGNPLFVTELVGALLEEGAVLGVADRANLAPEATLPPSLRLTILRRLSYLPPESLDVLQSAAVLGSSFSLADLSAFLGRPATEVFPLLREPLTAGVLSTNGLLTFRHDLIRDAIYEDLPLAVRKGLHLQAGRALAAAGAPSSQVATHLALGASPDDTDAVAWLRRTGREAVPRAPEIAAGFLSRALELIPRSDPERQGLVGELVWSLLWSGRLSEAEALARDLLAQHREPEIRGVLEYALAKALVAQGRVAESLQELERAVTQPGLPDTVRADLLAELSLRRLHCRDLDGAASAGREALALGERSENLRVTCAALSSLSWVALFRGHMAEADELTERVVTIADADSTGEAHFVTPRNYRGLYLIQADRLDEAESNLQAGLDMDKGRAFAPVYHATRALGLFHSGEWDDALVEAETSLRLAEDAGAAVYSISAYGTLALIAIHRDELQTARAAIDAAEQEWSASGPARFGLAWMVSARALLEEAQGDRTMAMELLAGMWDLDSMLGMHGELQELGPDLVRLALAEGQMDRARDATLGMERLAGSANTPSAKGAAGRCRGLLEGDADALLAAVDEYRASPRLLERALVQEDAAVVLAKAGRAGEAVPLLNEALDAFLRLGALHDSVRAEASLRALGVRRGRRGKRGRPQIGWESLTETERRVVDLVAEGLTNRQIGERLFISRYTVETHVSHIFTKLGLSSRVELAARAARRTG